MKSFSTWVFSLLTMAVLLAGCDSFVSEVDDPIDVVTDDALNTPEQVPFLITGLQRSFSAAHDNFVLQGGGLSDELFFDRDLDGATFDTFEQIDDADIQFANNSVDGTFNNNSVLRFSADDLVERVNSRIEFADDEQAVKDEALYFGHFFGGVARYYFASHVGLDAGGGGGGIIDAGPFIPAPEMYDQALAKLDQAASTSLGSEPLNQKYINTLRARIYLLKGEFGNAASAATSGLAQGDASFQALYAVQEDNDFFNGAGPGRTQFAVPERYSTYDGAQVFDSPGDARDADLSTIRIPLYKTADTGGGAAFYEQAKYLDRDTPMEFLNWEENALMLAELAALRGQDISGNPFGTTDPLELINLVRTQYTGVGALPAGTTVDQDLIALEREKEFFVTGLRLLDQRRFGIDFIRQDLDLATGTETTDPVAGAWRYLPVTQSERNQNENL